MSQEKRYARQIVLEGVGQTGQDKLSRASVLVVGCGGLGAPVAPYLAGAGVGELVLIDGDVPELSNAHRQVLFTEGCTGTKAEVLSRHCANLNSAPCVRAQNGYLDASNVRDLVTAADLVLDCTDDPRSKYLLSDACHLLQTPLLHAAAQGFEGYIALFENDSPRAVTLRDLFPRPNLTLPDCATTGVLGTAVGIIGMLQANAALCYLLGIGSPPAGYLLTYNALDNSQLRIKIKKTYDQAIQPPWRKLETTRTALEAHTFDPSDYDGVFSMLDENREPELVCDATRITKRNPLQQCINNMEKDGRYLLYCNSGKLSLMLAAQLRKSGYEAYSLAGGLIKYGL